MITLARRFLTSWWFPIARIVTAGASLFIILGGLRMIDLTQSGIPDEYLAITLAFSIVSAFFFAILLESKVYQDAYEHKGLTPEEYPKDTRYRVGTFISIVLGVAIGMAVGGMLVPAYFIGAGLWTYALVCALCAGIAAPSVEMISHCGLRVWLVKTKKEIKDLAGELGGAEAVAGAVAGATAGEATRKEE